MEANMEAAVEEGMGIGNEEELSLSPSTISSSSAAVAASSSADPLECIVSEESPYSKEIKKLKEQLLLAEQKNAQKRQQILEMEEELKKLKSLSAKPDPKSIPPSVPSEDIQLSEPELRENSALAETIKESMHEEAPVGDSGSTPSERPAPPSPSDDSNGSSIQHLGNSVEQPSNPPKLPNTRAPVPMPNEAKKSLNIYKKRVNSIPKKMHRLNIDKRHQGFFCICGIKFNSRKTLDNHIQFQNSRNIKSASASRSPSPVAVQKKFGCAICSGGFKNNSDWRKHMKKTHAADPDTMPILCPDCGKTCRKMQIFIRHRATVHSKTQRKRTLKPAAKRRSELPGTSGTRASVPIPIIEIDDEDSEDGYGSSSPLIEPDSGPIIVDLEDEDEDDPEVLVLHVGTAAVAPPMIDEQEGGEEDTGDSSSLEIQSTDGVNVNGEGWCATCRVNYSTRAKLFRHKKGFHKMSTEAAKFSTGNRTNIESSSSHHQASSRDSDQYLCSCGVTFALKSRLMKHIAEESAAN